ncbi:MAG: hypothetical protein ACKOPG_07915 [Novosphingobium sp.]
MDTQARLIGAIILTYFVSRAALRVPNPLRKAWGISLVHLILLAVIVLALLILHGSVEGYSSESLLLYVSAQVLWWLVDLLREHPTVTWRIPRSSRRQSP